MEEAEGWGNEVYQPVPRRLVWNALRRDRSTIDTYLEGASIGIPLPIALRTVGPVIAAARHFNRASDEDVRRDLAALPALIDHVDELLARGVIGGSGAQRRRLSDRDHDRAARDYGRLRSLLEGQPALEHARRVAPSYAAAEAGLPGRLVELSRSVRSHP